MWHLLHVDKGNGGDPKEKLEVWERAKGGIALYDETPRSQWKKAGEVRVVVVVVADGAVEHQRRRKESSFPWKTGAFVKELLPSIGGATVVQAFQFPVRRRRRRLLLLGLNLVVVVVFLSGRRRNVSIVAPDGHSRRRASKVRVGRRTGRCFAAHPEVVVVRSVPRFGQSTQG